MLKYIPVKLINMDMLFINNNTVRNSNNIAYFHHRSIMQLINDPLYERPAAYFSWNYMYSKIYGSSASMYKYIISFLGCNSNVSFTNIDELIFNKLKSFLYMYDNFISINWYLAYLRLRTKLLPWLHRGKRYVMRLPSRGQRTRSNYKTCRRYKLISLYHFEQQLSTVFINENFPGWRQVEMFNFYTTEEDK